MGDSSSRNDHELRAQARQLIGAGRLPRAKAARTWGGLGSGLLCTLCSEPILNTEPEFELQFDTSSSTPPIRFHRHCHSIWESARHEPMMAHERWTPVSYAMPPAGIPVEVRWEMGDARVIILGSMMARDAGTGEWQWINLTTKAPLPQGWRPIEWRPSPNSAVDPITLSAATRGADESHHNPFIPKRA
jgi:hypothetical protein